MSVSSCAYLYQPEPDFDPNAFECWFQRPSWRYEPERPPEPEPEVPNDYVPHYSWLDSAVEHLLSLKKAKLIAKPKLKLVPYKRRELDPCEEEEVWDSEDYMARREFMEATRLLKSAKRRKGKFSYQEALPYIREMQAAARCFPTDLEEVENPSLYEQIFELIPGKKKRKK